MQLVERHIISRSHLFWGECDAICKNASIIRNQCLYLQRQSWFYGHGIPKFGKSIDHKNIDAFMQQTNCYSLLPSFLSQQVIKSINAEWTGFFEAQKAYNQSPAKFKGKPKPPKYKNSDGRYVATYPNTRAYKKSLNQGVIHLSCTELKINSSHASDFDCVRIVPSSGCYVIEVIYTVQEASPIESEWIAAIDLGVDTLAAVTSNKPGFQPILVNGKPLKSINQGYNKFKAELTSKVKKQSKQDWSSRLENLTRKRNQKINSYLHRASALICDLLVKENISKLVIGLNPDWKNEINLGKQTNQKFVGIPHRRFVDMLIYKLKLQGIEVIISEESYTSKASFLDADVIPTYGSKPEDWKPSGQRIKRGLYRSADGTLINADINGSYNILRKVFPNAFADGIESVVVAPRKVNLPGVVRFCCLTSTVA